MEIDTPGGVMRGDCATGRLARAMAPISVMTTDSTVAKIGRSMKNRANMPSFRAAARLRRDRYGRFGGAGYVARTSNPVAAQSKMIAAAPSFLTSGTPGSGAFLAGGAFALP